MRERAKMLVMIREIKQAARRILAWMFDDWREVHGHKERSPLFLFNDLDLSDAVDFKRLIAADCVRLQRVRRGFLSAKSQPSAS